MIQYLLAKKIIYHITA